MKRTVFTIVFLLLLLVPVGVSLLSWQAGQSTPLTEDTLVNITLTYPNGEERHFAGDTQDTEEQANIAVLLSLADPAIKETNKRPGLSASFDISSYSMLSFTTRYYTRSFRLYVSTQDTQITIAGKNGYFELPKETVRAFLSNALARPYYGAPTFPRPQLGDTPLPLTGHKLFVKTAGGALALADQSEPPTNTPISIASPSLSFANNLPSTTSLTATLTAGEDVLFTHTGTPAEVSKAFSALRLTRTGAAHLVITARYSEALTRPWYGEVTWEAPVSLDITPLATLSETEVVAGTPVKLNINRPTDISTLSVFVEWLDRTFRVEELSVLSDGYALLLPTPLDTTEPTRCKVIVSADGVTWDPLTVMVTPHTASESIRFEKTENSNFSMSFELGGETRYNKHLSTLSAHYQDQICKNALQKEAPTALRAPISASGDFVEIAHPGQTLIVRGGTYEFTHTMSGRWYFTAIKDTDFLGVYAVADGTVVATGETDYGGYYVVVDHGGGLCSTYLNLAAPSELQKEQNVLAGNILGQCGTSGMTRTDEDCANVTVILTLHGVPVIL